MKWRVFAIGLGVIIAFYILFLIIPWLFGITLEFFSYPLVYIAVIIAGICMAISAFLPYKWGGVVLRNVAYFCLFVLVLLLEFNVMKVALERFPPQEITLESCTTLFGNKEKPDSVTDAIAVWSCITTGYFPSTGEKATLGWIVFAIFYIILPFAFIWTFLYGMMSGIGFGSLFGGFEKTANTLLSFIISMYATRQLFGFFLLDMFGYGVWGLVGVFIAAFLVKGLQHIIERWFEIEKYGESLENAMKVALELEKNAKKALYMYLKDKKGLRGQALISTLKSITTPGTMANQAFINLGPLKGPVEVMINNVISGKAKMDDLLKLLKD